MKTLRRLRLAADCRASVDARREVPAISEQSSVIIHVFGSPLDDDDPNITDSARRIRTDDDHDSWYAPIWLSVFSPRTPSSARPPPLIPFFIFLFFSGLRLQNSSDSLHPHQTFEFIPRRERQKSCDWRGTTVKG